MGIRLVPDEQQRASAQCDRRTRAPDERDGVAAAPGPGQGDQRWTGQREVEVEKAADAEETDRHGDEVSDHRAGRHGDAGDDREDGEQRVDEKDRQQVPHHLTDHEDTAEQVAPRRQGQGEHGPDDQESQPHIEVGEEPVHLGRGHDHGSGHVLHRVRVEGARRQGTPNGVVQDVEGGEDTYQ